MTVKSICFTQDELFESTEHFTIVTFAGRMLIQTCLTSTAGSVGSGSAVPGEMPQSACIFMQTHRDQWHVVVPDFMIQKIEIKL